MDRILAKDTKFCQAGGCKKPISEWKGGVGF